MGGTNMMKAWESSFSQWKNPNELIYIDMIKQKKGRVRLYGRLLSFDMNEQYIQVYNDDEKSVYKFTFREIDDIASTKN
jgi:hypothetical protein